MKKMISVILMVFLVVTLSGCQMQAPKEEFTVVTSFYPMYVMAKNIAKGIEGVAVENMTSQTVGCLHDYTLTTADLVKVESADVFIINGLGIENFTGKIQETYDNLTMIEASKKVTNFITEGDEINAHIWLDIENYQKQVETIQEELMKLDTNHAGQYRQNGEEYQKQLETLKAEIKDHTLLTKRCLSFSESLAYLQKSMNLNMKIIETDHEQNGLSAEKLAETIEYVKENHIQNILLDKETADQNAQIVANETGAKIYRLNSGLTGSEAEDSYLTLMRENLEQVKQMEE